MRALFLALLVLAPLAAAEPGDTHAYVFTTSGSLLVDVRYDDGVGTTKFGFMQVAGQNGGPTQRLEAGATCTEWRGTFTQVLVEATAAKRASAATFSIVGAAAGTGPVSRDTPGFVVDAAGGAGALIGSLLVCDEPGGEGLVRLNVDVAPLPLARAQPTLVRLTEA